MTPQPPAGGARPPALHWEIRAEIPAGAAEAADTVLLELGDGGWSVLEDVPGRRAWVIGIFPGEDEAQGRWRILRPLLPAAPLGEPVVRPLPEAEWRDSYKAHFRAWSFGRLHWVPVWERPSFRLPPGHAVLWLDPGMAFGTGNHETTRLCIEELIAIDGALAAAGAARKELNVIDAGCGSGILALSAALLGFGRIEGFDNDPEAVRMSRENAVLNAIDGRVHFFAADLAEGLKGRRADVLLANIQADILIRHASVLTGAIAPRGVLVLSGILALELEEVRSVFSRVAPEWPANTHTSGEWSSLVLSRPA